MSPRGVPFARRTSNERYANTCVRVRPEGESVPIAMVTAPRRVAPPLGRSVVVGVRSGVFGRARARSGGFAHERGQPVSRRWQSPRDQFPQCTYSRRSVIGVQPPLSRSVPDLAYIVHRDPRARGRFEPSRQLSRANGTALVEDCTRLTAECGVCERAAVARRPKANTCACRLSSRLDSRRPRSPPATALLVSGRDDDSLMRDRSPLSPPPGARNLSR